MRRRLSHRLAARQPLPAAAGDRVRRKPRHRARRPGPAGTVLLRGRPRPG